MSVELLERARSRILEAEREAQTLESPKSPEEQREIKDTLDFLFTNCKQILEEKGVSQGRLFFKDKIFTRAVDVNSVPVNVSIYAPEWKGQEFWDIRVAVESIKERLVLSKHGSHHILTDSWHWRPVTKKDAQDYQEVVNLLK